MESKKIFLVLTILLSSVFFTSPVEAAWPILNDADMDKFVRTFPTMYRDYKQLTLTVNPAAGPAEKTRFDQEINRILTDNGWNFFFWIQMPHIIRCYSFVKQEQVRGAHGSDIEKFVHDLINSDWMTPGQKSGINDFFSQLKGNYENEAEKIKREVHENDLNLVRRNIARLDSVLEAITKVEIEAAQGILGKSNLRAPDANSMPAAITDSVSPVAAGMPQALPVPAAGQNPMVHQQGTLIVDGAGQPIKLRGALIEGWLMWNGPLWGTGLNSETHIYKKIVELVGEEEAARFRQAVYDSFFTEADVKLMADMGFNVMRVPFNHTVLEDDARPYFYKESGWRLLDRLFEWGEKHGVYVVPDLHSAPGGQATTFVGDPEKELIWDSEEKKRRTIALWKAIASRYKDRHIIAGYDLLNEPHPHQKADLVDMYQRITAAIREVDPHHMVILTGSGLATDFSMYKNLPAQPVANMAYTFHTYNFFSSSVDKNQVKDMKALSDKHQTPIWNSEFGANTTEWVKGSVDLYEDPQFGISGWIYWPWKRVGEQESKRWAGLMEIPKSPNWDKTRSWIGALFGLGVKPSRDEALQGMCEFIQMSGAHNLAMNSQMAMSLRLKPAGTEKKPDTLVSIQAVCDASQGLKDGLQPQ